MNESPVLGNDKPLWNVQLFGQLVARDPTALHSPVCHFRTQRSAALLAYLAYFSDRPHTREELAEFLWPEADPVVTRARLRQELATLRRQLEGGPGFAAGSVFETIGRELIGLRRGAVRTDVEEFETLVSYRAFPRDRTRGAALERAVALHGNAGLLPGRSEPWIDAERDRLARLHAGCLRSVEEMSVAVKPPRLGPPISNGRKRGAGAAPVFVCVLFTEGC